MDIAKISLIDTEEQPQELFQRYYIANTFWVDSTEEPTLEQVENILNIMVKPNVITALQAKTVLVHVGLYDIVDSTINNSNNNILKIAWNSAQTFDRNSSFITNMQTSLGLSNTYVDTMFLTASYIK